MDRNLWIKIRCFLMLSGRKRTDYLIRKKVFASVGEGFVFFPRKIPQDPQFIRFHNNVVVATDVMFVNHDIIHEMLNGKSKSDRYKKYFECIEIKDNVFIGCEKPDHAGRYPGARCGRGRRKCGDQVVWRRRGHRRKSGQSHWNAGPAGEQAASVRRRKGRPSDKRDGSSDRMGAVE